MVPLGEALAFLAITRLGCLGANTLAYLASSSLTKKGFKLSKISKNVCPWQYIYGHGQSKVI